MAGNKGRRDIPPVLYQFTDMTISSATNTNLGVASGCRYGPNLSEALAGITSTTDVSWKNNTAFVSVGTGASLGVILWTVPTTAIYRIEIWGARGGNVTNVNYLGGYGARMRGDFSLTGGQVLKILIGQMGGAQYAGGGGGTFVATNANVPLICAGGGNSTSAWSSSPVHATTSTTGVNSPSGGDLGGINGLGGASTSGAGQATAGGAGFFGNGINSSCAGSTAPLSFVTGGIGGATCNALGGFGGGSASDGCCQGASGAGGGYSGGGGGLQTVGAGGSYNIGNNQSNDGGNVGTAVLSGGGKCIITKIS